MRSLHTKHFRPWPALWLGLCLPLLLSACATSGQMDALEKAQYAYSAAIRWGDFEGGWTMVDPKYRDEHPMTNLEFERFNQIQVSGYRDLASQVGEMTAVREIEIGLINRHNMTTRSMRYTERWRYEPETKSWWITNGLPDFWAGE